MGLQQILAYARMTGRRGEHKNDKRCMDSSGGQAPLRMTKKWETPQRDSRLRGKDRKPKKRGDKGKRPIWLYLKACQGSKIHVLKATKNYLSPCDLLLYDSVESTDSFCLRKKNNLLKPPPLRTKDLNT